MTVQIPLSVVGEPNAFAASLEAHCVALAKHRMAGLGVPVPMHPFDFLVQRVPDTGPVATRKADTFIIAPYEIVDDTPPVPPPPTLEEKKQELTFELQRAQQATINAILSPARVRLLSMDASEAMSVPEQSRTPAQTACIDAFVAFQSRVAEINKNAAVVGIEIEDLTDANIDSWKLPSL